MYEKCEEKQHLLRLGKPKKSSFFSGPAAKAFTLPPLGLVAIRNFFP